MASEKDDGVRKVWGLILISSMINFEIYAEIRMLKRRVSNSNLPNFSGVDIRGHGIAGNIDMKPNTCPSVYCLFCNRYLCSTFRLESDSKLCVYVCVFVMRIKSRVQAVKLEYYCFRLQFRVRRKPSLAAKFRNNHNIEDLTSWRCPGSLSS